MLVYLLWIMGDVLGVYSSKKLADEAADRAKLRYPYKDEDIIITSENLDADVAN